jgi:hypothetical protein
MRLKPRLILGLFCHFFTVAGIRQALHFTTILSFTSSGRCKDAA